MTRWPLTGPACRGRMLLTRALFRCSRPSAPPFVLVIAPRPGIRPSGWRCRSRRCPRIAGGHPIQDDAIAARGSPDRLRPTIRAIGLIPEFEYDDEDDLTDDDRAAEPCALAWTAYSLPTNPATANPNFDQIDLGEAEYALKSAVRSAAETLGALQLGSSGEGWTTRGLVEQVLGQSIDRITPEVDHQASRSGGCPPAGDVLEERHDLIRPLGPANEEGTAGASIPAALARHSSCVLAPPSAKIMVPVVAGSQSDNSAHGLGDGCRILHVPAQRARESQPSSSNCIC